MKDKQKLTEGPKFQHYAYSVMENVSPRRRYVVHLNIITLAATPLAMSSLPNTHSRMPY